MSASKVSLLARADKCRHHDMGITCHFGSVELEGVWEGIVEKLCVEDRVEQEHLDARFAELRNEVEIFKVFADYKHTVTTLMGTTITPGNEYALVFKEELHLSLATLESREEYGSTSGSPCHLILTTKRTNYLLCTLLNRVVYQQALDLTLMPNEKVTFKCQGETNIHLTGYTRKESTNIDQQGSLDERVQGSANASLDEHTAENTAISDLPAAESTCTSKDGVEHDATNVEDFDDCNQGNETAMLDSFNESGFVRKNRNEDNDVCPAIEQSDVERERGKILSKECSGTEAILKGGDGQEENILARAFRDCIMGKEEVAKGYGSDMNMIIGRNLDHIKESSEDLREDTLGKVSHTDVQYETEGNYGTFLKGKGIKTEKEERLDGETFQEKQVGIEDRYINNGDISMEINCKSRVQSVKDHRGLSDVNSVSVKETERRMGSIMITRTNCKEDDTSRIVSVLDNMRHDNGVIDSVRNNTPGGSYTDADVKSISANMINLSGACKRESKSNISQVTDDSRTCEKSITSLVHHESHTCRRVPYKLDSYIAGDSKEGKQSKCSKKDQERKLNNSKRELGNIQKGFGSNPTIEDCLAIVSSIQKSDPDDSKLQIKREETTFESCDELPELQLVDLLPDIDDIIIKEEIDLDNTEGLEDMEIMLLNSFYGSSISDAQDLTLKNEDLSFEGLLDGHCFDGRLSALNNPHRNIGTWDTTKQHKVPDITELSQLRLDALEKILHLPSSEPIDFKLDVPNLHPEEQRFAQSQNEKETNEANKHMSASRSQQEIESILSGVFAQSDNRQDVFTEKARNLKVTLSRREVRKAMSDQVVIKEEDDGQVHTEDETDASSRSEVSEDETDWESIVESRSERDTKKRKSKTKAKEVTAKLLKEIGDVVESDDENQTELPQDREEGNQKEKTDNREKDTHSAQANVRTSLGKHFKGERAFKSKFNKKRKQHRTENLTLSESSINLNTEKCNKRKEKLSGPDDMQAPQKKKFCLPVTLSLMQNVKTPRHRRRVNHTRLKCKYCSKSYLYTGSLRRHENAHRESHRSSMQGRPFGEIRKKLKLQKLLPSVQTNNEPVKGRSSKKELGTAKAKECYSHKTKCASGRKDFLKINNILPITDTQKQLDVHNKESETVQSSVNVKLSKPSGNFTRQENAHAQPRPFKCTFCPKTFIHEGSLRSHELSHDDKTFKCSKCEKGFTRPDQMEQHESLKHGLKMSLSCHICKTRFTSSSDCDIHFQKNHVNPKIFSDKCKKTSTNSETMECDKSTGEKILPHRCKSCGKRFRLQSVLEQHECVHKGKKQFSCRHCKKSFQMLDNCKRHEKKHNKDNSVGSQAGDVALKQVGNRDTNPKLTTKAALRPFKCHYCSKTFSLMAVRNSHEKKHAGEKERAGDKKIFSHLTSKRADQVSKKNISHHDSKVATFNES